MPACSVCSAGVGTASLRHGGVAALRSLLEDARQQAGFTDAELAALTERAAP